VPNRVADIQTTGWRPSCECGAETMPCTVLDPFSGSGTTGLVAVANRSNYIGIELNPEYAAMSRRRLEEATAQAVLL
jgi:site-specific DNA-methyltransferase (adenine-specific)